MKKPKKPVSKTVKTKSPKMPSMGLDQMMGGAMPMGQMPLPFKKGNKK